MHRRSRALAAFGKTRKGQVIPPTLDLKPYSGRYELEAGEILRILPEPPFLRLSAENQAAADLLASEAESGFRDAQRFNEKVATLIEALRSKDKSTASEIVQPGQAFDRLWKERKRFRKAQDARILATAQWLGQALTTAELRTKEGWSNILFLWHPDGERIESWGMSRSLPAEARYLPREAAPSSARFEAFDPARATELRFTSEDGKVLGLEVLGQRARPAQGP